MTTMPPLQRAALTGLLALWLAPLPAHADSQSSNSSSNCSGGLCTRLETYTREDDGRRRGWGVLETWREDQRRQLRRDRDDNDDDGPRRRRPRRDRDDDDDD
jgi:hypothetical protein